MRKTIRGLMQDGLFFSKKSKKDSERIESTGRAVPARFLFQKVLIKYTEKSQFRRGQVIDGTGADRYNWG